MKPQSILLAATAAVCLTGCVRWGGGRLPTARPTPAATEPAAEEVLQSLDEALAALEAGLADLEPVEIPIP